MAQWFYGKFALSFFLFGKFLLCSLFSYSLYLKKDCPKGELDKKKFTEVYKEFYPQGKADKFCAQVFNVFDVDHSGA